MNDKNPSKPTTKINLKFYHIIQVGKRFVAKIVLVGTVMIVLLSTVTSCSGYRHYTFRNIISDSSFEYPASYTITSVNEGELQAGAWVLLTPKLRPEGSELILVAVKKTSNDFPDYFTSLDHALQGVQKEQYTRDFKLQDRSRVTIDKAQGEQIVYHFLLENEIDGLKAIAYEVYFQKNDAIWTIWAHALAENAEQTKTDFEHLLKTFKFLD
ncbi:MAG: hypothetical protein A2144_11675 [Chloroflexi bacterium RBG_16_50_9]|nr:MAG: hypothetical protein A2144_11675 [Chloroflexi bacterium RBG_16_50_9]